MLRIVMYGPDAEENHRIRELMEDLLWDAQIKPVFKEFNGEREPFFAYVKNNTYLIMLVVQSGPEGMETVRLAKERNPELSGFPITTMLCTPLTCGSPFSGCSLPAGRKCCRPSTTAVTPAAIRLGATHSVYHRLHPFRNIKSGR